MCKQRKPAALPPPPPPLPPPPTMQGPSDKENDVKQGETGSRLARKQRAGLRIALASAPAAAAPEAAK